MLMAAQRVLAARHAWLSAVTSKARLDGDCRRHGPEVPRAEYRR